MLVVLLCVLLMSLSYLFVISGGLQFKHPTNYGQDRVINNVFSINNRLRQEELLNQEKVSLQYNKLARLNQSIKKVNIKDVIFDYRYFSIQSKVISGH